MLGALDAAKRADWETAYVCREEDAPQAGTWADAVMLPWPRSFEDGRLAGTQLPRERALELLPASDDDEIRKNIIYYGLPAVLHGVANGTFRKKKRGKKQ